MGYLELIKQADSIFQKFYPGSILFSATGSPPTGSAKTPEQLTNWIFLSQTSNETAQLKYSNGSFGEPSIIGRWTGLEFKPLPQGTIRLPQAIEILNSHGYEEFINVGMGTPLIPDAQPMFWFCCNSEIQGVSASTGEFFENLFPCHKSQKGVGSLGKL